VRLLSLFAMFLTSALCTFLSLGSTSKDRRVCVRAQLSHRLLSASCGCVCVSYACVSPAAGPMIIFVATKAGTEELSKNLVKAGYQVGCLHGDILQHERLTTMQRVSSNTASAGDIAG
jgi:superfamily II DNA/RNA helicase